jgi:hypothetical protein
MFDMDNIERSDVEEMIEESREKITEVEANIDQIEIEQEEAHENDLSEQVYLHSKKTAQVSYLFELQQSLAELLMVERDIAQADYDPSEEDGEAETEEGEN